MLMYLISLICLVIIVSILSVGAAGWVWFYRRVLRPNHRFGVSTFEYILNNHAFPNMVFIIGCIVSIFVAITGPQIMLDKITKDIWNSRDIPLVAFNDIQGMEGKLYGGIFIMSAYIRDELVYYCYYEVSDGGYKYWKIDAADATIYENNSIAPHIAIWRTDLRPTKLQKVLLWPFANNTDALSYYYKIYVPRGSINRKYNLDLQ